MFYKEKCAWLPVEVDFGDHLVNLTLYFFSKEIIIAKKWKENDVENSDHRSTIFLCNFSCGFKKDHFAIFKKQSVDLNTSLS